MSIVYDWALSIAEKHAKGKPIERRDITDIKLYAEGVGTTTGLYEDGNGNAILLIYYDLSGTSSEVFVTNLEQLKAESPDIVRVWLNSGRRLYTRLTRGKGLKVISFDDFRDGFEKPNTQSSAT